MHSDTGLASPARYDTVPPDMTGSAVAAEGSGVERAVLNIRQRKTSQQ